LSFIVFLPDWVDPPTPSNQALRNSPFLRADISLPAGEHFYFSKFLPHETFSGIFDRKFSAVHPTRVFFLQNDAGYQKWPPKEEKLAGLQRVLLAQDHAQ
jgi:phosphorylated CTD-interacting factor 1